MSIPSRTLTLSNPPGLYDPSANGYSHVAEVAAGARLIFIAGQGGETADGELSADFTDQVRQALANLQVALRPVGAEVSHVAKLTVLIVDHSQARLEIFGAQLQQLWSASPTPACTLIPVPRLALDGMLFEIEAVAVLPD
ncbi:RidA family protein [Pseudomonas proteolytica]|uniref:RidA family protein n=1 Tax=Pseudomonas proteolytica TaxID=219574 RepID=UPI001644B747|nr:RidA family protein [Pseudomonas proteolytica]MBC3338933.1 RidA family protein [Pseudomonas proteolytica]